MNLMLQLHDKCAGVFLKTPVQAAGNNLRTVTENCTFFGQKGVLSEECKVDLVTYKIHFV